MITLLSDDFFASMTELNSLMHQAWEEIGKGKELGILEKFQKNMLLGAFGGVLTEMSSSLSTLDELNDALARLWRALLITSDQMSDQSSINARLLYHANVLQCQAQNV